mmetsp:Transcript_18657/g.63017  ORF Transcript_18657/g.63017 Transcript_18657/m.63017 type:complete len:201 (-) Transcript_18657:432-1034(-)
MICATSTELADDDAKQSGVASSSSSWCAAAPLSSKNATASARPAAAAACSDDRPRSETLRQFASALCAKARASLGTSPSLAADAMSRDGSCSRSSVIKPHQRYLASTQVSFTCSADHADGLHHPDGGALSQTALAFSLPPALTRYFKTSGDHLSSRSALSLEKSAPSLRCSVAQSAQRVTPTAMDTHSTAPSPHSAHAGF